MNYSDRQGNNYQLFGLDFTTVKNLAATAEDDGKNSKFDYDYLFEKKQEQPKIDFFEYSEEMPISFYENVGDLKSQAIFMKNYEEEEKQEEKLEKEGKEEKEEQAKFEEKELEVKEYEEKKIESEMNQKEEKNKSIQNDVDKFLLEQNEIFKKMKKNSNVPKFLVRLFIKYARNPLKESQIEEAYKYHLKVNRQLQKLETNNFKIADLLNLLGRNKLQFSFLNRKIMQSILSQVLEDEVITNKYVGLQHKRSYMLAAKVYALRCRNLTLSERVKIQ